MARKNERPGWTRVYKLVPKVEADALAWVRDWYARRGWTVADDGEHYVDQGKYLMVSAWAQKKGDSDVQE